jgi:energy-coupling factor transporter ATP-binding protein EcfA2
MIEIQSLTYRYPGTGQSALTDLSLAIPEGQFVSIVGPNGAGKSTLCYALAGFVPSFFRGQVQGTIRVAGMDPIASGPSILVGTVGLVIQDPFSQVTGARFSLAEEVAFGLENLGVAASEMPARVMDALRVVRLEALAGRSPFELSGGEQQRLALAAILVLQPKVLILDEPTSHLDPQGVREVIAAVDRLTAERKTTVVLVEQKLEWMAAHVDRTIVLKDGRVAVDGPPQAVLTSSEIEGWGLRRTQYTRAAEAASLRGWTNPANPLPATLEQAVRFFQ